MTSLTQQLKKALAALAYADAGEMLTGTEKNRALGIRPLGKGTRPVVPRGMPPATELPKNGTATVLPSIRVQVGLYLGATLSDALINYASDTCRRLDAVLTIVTFQPKESARGQLQPYLADLGRNGVVWRIVSLSGEPRQALARYLKSEARMLFLVCNEAGFLGHTLLSDGPRRPDLGLPVVVVTGDVPQTGTALGARYPRREAS